MQAVGVFPNPTVAATAFKDGSKEFSKEFNALA
jgi:hypothetical protein